MVKPCFSEGFKSGMLRRLRQASGASEGDERAIFAKRDSSSELDDSSASGSDNDDAEAEASDSLCLVVVVSRPRDRALFGSGEIFRDCISPSTTTGSSTAPIAWMYPDADLQDSSDVVPTGASPVASDGCVSAFRVTSSCHKERGDCAADEELDDVCALSVNASNSRCSKDD